MLKYLISLMTAFASLMAFLVMGNTAVANSVENSTVDQTTSHIATEIVNLNVSSPFLQLNNKTATPIFEHLGCSCAVCTQGTVNLSLFQKKTHGYADGMNSGREFNIST